MKIWEMKIINMAYEIEEYERLRLAGWEPFHFVLVAAPPGPGALLSGNGSPQGMAMIQVVGMRFATETEFYRVTETELEDMVSEEFPKARDYAAGFPRRQGDDDAS